MSYIDELEARFPTKGVTFICEVQAMRHGEACATVDRLRVSIAASRARCEELEADNRALREALQGAYDYIKSDKCACEFEADGDEYTCRRCRVVDMLLEALPTLAPKEGNAP